LKNNKNECLLFLIASIAIFLSLKKLLSASAIAKPSFFTAAKTTSLSFLNIEGNSLSLKPFFLTIFNA